MRYIVHGDGTLVVFQGHGNYGKWGYAPKIEYISTITSSRGVSFGSEKQVQVTTTLINSHNGDRLQASAFISEVEYDQRHEYWQALENNINQPRTLPTINDFEQFQVTWLMLLRNLKEQ